MNAFEIRLRDHVGQVILIKKNLYWYGSSSADSRVDMHAVVLGFEGARRGVEAIVEDGGDYEDSAIVYLLIDNKACFVGLHESAVEFLEAK